MPYQLVIDNINDIYKFPQPVKIPQEQSDIEVSIGDLHGNAIKLLFMLIRYGMVANITKAQYQRLVTLYRTAELTQENLDEFDGIIATITFRQGAFMRLIGDELADRGSNDYFTLTILNKLHQDGVRIESLVSNHSMEFMLAYEKQETFKPATLHREHCRSMLALEKLVEQGFRTREQMVTLFKESYKPYVKAISYALNADNSGITIFSHAGIGLNTIKALAKLLDITYKDSTTDQLARTIDYINAVFQSYVKNNHISIVYTQANMIAGYCGLNLSDDPLAFIIWNRNYQYLDRPEQHNGYNLNFIHGHDSNDPNPAACIDDLAGKTALMEGPGELLVENEGNKLPIKAFVQWKNSPKPSLLIKEELHNMRNNNGFLEQIFDSASSLITFFKDTYHVQVSDPRAAFEFFSHTPNPNANPAWTLSTKTYGNATAIILQHADQFIVDYSQGTLSDQANEEIAKYMAQKITQIMAAGEYQCQERARGDMTQSTRVKTAINALTEAKPSHPKI
jgi:hypothetical protein